MCATYGLGLAEQRALDALVEDVLDSRLDPEGAPLYAHGWELAARLPDGLRKALYEFRVTGTEAALLVRGLYVDDPALGRPPAAGTRRESVYLALTAMGLAEVFSRGGPLVRDVPAPDASEPDASEPDASEGDAGVELGTADGAGPGRGDYLGLLALAPATITVAALGDVPLAASRAGLLRRSRFRLTGRPGPVLHEDHAEPSLRLDPFRATADATDPQAAAALGALRDGLRRAAVPIALDAGDVLLVDNFRALTGQRAGRLRRVLLARDLRRLGPRRTDLSVRVLTSPENVSDERP